MRPIAGSARLVGVGEDEDLTVADGVNEVVRELAEVPGSKQRLAPPASVRRRGVRPLEDQVDSGMGLVRELVPELAFLDP